MRTRISMLVGVAFVATVLVAPTPSQALSGFTTIKTSYGPSSAQSLTVYVPKAGGPHPAVLFVHGGCWMRGGLQSDERAIAERIAERTGYVVAAMTYRTSQPKYLNMPADVSAALQKLQNGPYNVIRNRVALWGESAGAHLSLLHAYRTSGPAGTNRPRAIVSVSGPTNMVSEYASAAASCVASFEGGRPSPDLRARYRSTSPVHWVDPSDPPTLLATASIDHLVPPTQTTDLATRLRANRVEARVVTSPGAKHGTRLEDARIAGGGTVFEAGVDFLRAYL